MNDRGAVGLQFFQSDLLALNSIRRRAYYESKKHFSVKSHLPLCSLLIFHVYMSDKSQVLTRSPIWHHFLGSTL